MKKYIILSFVLIIGIVFGFGLKEYFNNNSFPLIADEFVLDDQEATIRAINKVIPSVVSIIVYDTREYYNINLKTGVKELVKDEVQEGQGTGFIISSDGFILTNKHVVNNALEKTGTYKILLNSGKQYFAQLIGKDPLNDLAVLKIFDKNLPYVEFGDSKNLPLGTSVIAIGNALGKYDNSVTKGIVSGLGRSIVASDQSGNATALDNVIQIDAEINLGNSGGPLIDLYGKVIGINVAVDQAGSSIGFAIPINDARPVINSIRSSGRIIRTSLGVRYFMLTPELAIENELKRDSGAIITTGESNEVAIVPGSPADKAGLQENDIIFEINAVPIDKDNTLLEMIQKYKPGYRIGMKVLRGEKVIILIAELAEFK
jgi:S1-C subfamily serine protease